MINQNVMIYLSTPLREPDEDNPALKGVCRIRGKVFSVEAIGLVVEVAALGDGRKWNEGVPFKKIFVPTHKIDFVSLN